MSFEKESLIGQRMNKIIDDYYKEFLQELDPGLFEKMEIVSVNKIEDYKGFKPKEAKYAFSYIKPSIVNKDDKIIEQSIPMFVYEIDPLKNKIASVIADYIMGKEIEDAKFSGIRNIIMENCKREVDRLNNQLSYGSTTIVATS